MTLDTGALVAAERNDRRFWALYADATRAGVVAVVPSPCVAEAWRSPRQARLAQLLKGCRVEVLDEGLARAAGELCARAGTSDPVDAAVVASAARRGGDQVVTADSRDLGALAAHAPGVEVLAL